MAGELAAWFKAAVARAVKEGRWESMTALAHAAGVDRQVLYDIQKGRQAGQEKVSAIAKALGVSAPRVGALVAQRGASAAVLEALASVRADLEAAAEQLRAVEAELTSGGEDGEIAAGATRRKRAGDSALRPDAKRRGAGGA